MCSPNNYAFKKEKKGRKGKEGDLFEIGVYTVHNYCLNLCTFFFAQFCKNAQLFDGIANDKAPFR